MGLRPELTPFGLGSRDSGLGTTVDNPQKAA